MDHSSLVTKYEKGRSNYENFSDALSNLIMRLLGADEVQMHSVSHRCKSLDSFKVKIEKKGGYSALEQITDLAGVRLITHYEDDVDKVAKIIESEFTVDIDNSIDKRKAIEPDKFGYLSLHYVVSLKADRTELKEYRSFSGLKAEVQIRSLLQHTWAEIEHDTGYKSDVEVPRHIRRRFSRLAGLLELADQEFIGIRTELENYSAAVAQQISEPAEDGLPLSDVMIDKISLKKFYEIDPLVTELDGEISKMLNAKSGADVEHALEDVGRLKLVGIESLAQLKNALVTNRELILDRARSIAKKGAAIPSEEFPDWEIRFAISTLYLLQVLAAKSGDISTVKAVLHQMGFRGENLLAKTLIEIVKARS